MESFQYRPAHRHGFASPCTITTHGLTLASRPGRRRRHGRHGSAHRAVEGRRMGRGGRHDARPGRVHRPRRPDPEHGAAPGANPRAVLADAVLAAAGRGDSAPAWRMGHLAPLVAGDLAGAHHASAARRDDGLRHPAGAAVLEPSVCGRQRVHHRPAVHAAAARGRHLGAGHAGPGMRSSRQCRRARAEHGLPGLGFRGAAACRSGRACGAHRAGHFIAAGAGHADGVQHAAVARRCRRRRQLPRGFLLAARRQADHRIRPF